MMFLLEDAPCEAGFRRGRLHHSWIKNQILSWQIEDLLAIPSGDSPARTDFEDRIRPGGALEQELAVAKILCQSMLKGFSGALLVDLCPLSDMPVEEKRIIKDVLHQ